MSADPGALSADLHSHSLHSDGTLSPRALVERARAHGVQLYALTDHDQLAGLPEAAAAAQELGVAFLPGVEISVTWGGTTLHIVGLGVAPTDATLVAGVSAVRAGRLQRAQQMGALLEAHGIPGAFEGALARAGTIDLVSRTHFARFLVDAGVCRDVSSVFDRYLVAGKPGYVPTQWAALADAVGWIRAAGGVAVLAHPGRYALSALQLDALLLEFKALGGVAIEVCTGSHDAAATRRFADVARRYGFEASRGSDFHGPGESHVEMNGVPPLPADLVPVWHRYA